MYDASSHPSSIIFPILSAFWSVRFSAPHFFTLAINYISLFLHYPLSCYGPSNNGSFPSEKGCSGTRVYECKRSVVLCACFGVCEVAWAVCALWWYDEIKKKIFNVMLLFILQRYSINMFSRWDSEVPAILVSGQFHAFYSLRRAHNGLMIHRCKRK